MKHSTRLLNRVYALCVVLLLTLACLAHVVAAQSGSVDCSGVLLSYYPNPPEAGETIYLNAGVNSSIGNAPGYYGRWVLGEEDLGGSTIDEWSGCTIVVQFEYFCGGSERRSSLIIPGADCSSRFGGQTTLIIGVVAAVIVLAIVSRMRKAGAERAERKRAQQAAKVQRNAVPSAPAGGTGFCGSCGARLVPGDDFCRSCGRPVGK